MKTLKQKLEATGRILYIDDEVIEDIIDLSVATQCEKILHALEDGRGKWVSGRHFFQKLSLKQYHARIFELQRKGYKIEASDDEDFFGFKSYRLVRDLKFHL